MNHTKKRIPLSFARFWAIVIKEFIQMRRDRLTFGMIIGIPVVQLMLFGYAINGDPKHLPTAVLLADNSQQGRSLLSALKNSDYFTFVREVKSEADADAALATGEVQFVVTIPENFGRTLLRGDRPTVLVEADATDPSATGNAIASLRTLLESALRQDLKGPLAFLAGSDGPVNLRVHARYNPEGISQYNIVPGLMGVVLTMTMVMITGLAITRERERGTMENLLSMPTRPRTPKRFMRCRGHDICVRHGTRMMPRGHKARKMRHIHHQKRPDLIGNLPSARKINDPRIR